MSKTGKKKDRRNAATGKTRKAAKRNGFTPMQERFILEYPIDLKGTEAAKRAGAAPDGAHVTASRWLSDVKIRGAIQEELNRRAKATRVTAERVVHELAAIAFANMAEYITTQPDGSALVDLSALRPEQAAAIQEITSDVYMDGTGEDARPVKRTKLKLYSRPQALEMLGRHLALFVDRTRHEGEITLAGVAAVPGVMDPAKWDEAFGRGEADEEAVN